MPVTSLSPLLETLQAAQDLTAEEVGHAVALLFSPSQEDTHKAAFLLALRQKGETATEIVAFVRSLLSHAVDPGISLSELPGPALDVCGTGGDRLDLFNISTTSMFVLAAGGAVVIKHGNRAITSQCGGADVLEALGISIDLPPEKLRECVKRAGLGFVFAPHYHPSFKSIGTVRKQLAAAGHATIFNVLGPLLNPVQPPFQLTGIFDRSLIQKYAEVFAMLGKKRAWALHGAGADEVSLWDVTHVAETVAGSEGIRAFQIDPAALGLPASTPAALRGGNCAENAHRLTSILNGSERGASRAIVTLNAAAGFVIAGLAPDLSAGLAFAEEQIDSGRAIGKLRYFQEVSEALARADR